MTRTAPHTTTISGLLMLGIALLARPVLAQGGAPPAAARVAPSAVPPVQSAPGAPSQAPAAPASPPLPPASPPAQVQASEPGAPATAAPSSATCVERLPEGKSRPQLVERFPSRGLAGHAAWLEVEIEHERAEKVMPGGLGPAMENAESAHLERAGFVLPDPAGGAKPRLTTEPKGTQSLTRLALPVVPLPEKPGRNELELPPLPIAIARASGDVITLCTSPHALVVDEPIANEPNPKPKLNPPPQRQLELWEAAKQITLVVLATLAVAGLVALVLFKLGLLGYLKRLVWREKPAPPPRPPWETAMEELFDIRNAGLISAGRYAEHFDRVSDTVRKYLGALYEFDGLESTTREVLQRLRRVAPGLPVLGELEAFLRNADLVKFARLTPTEVQCERALAEAEHIVTSTRPAPAPSVPDTTPVPGSAGDSTPPLPEPLGTVEAPISPYAPPPGYVPGQNAPSRTPDAQTSPAAARELDAPTGTRIPRSEEER